MAATYVEVIEELRNLVGVNHDIKSKMAGIASDYRYSRSDREVSKAMAEAFGAVEERLRAVTAKVGALALANSSEDFEKITEALTK